VRDPTNYMIDDTLNGIVFVLFVTVLWPFWLIGYMLDFWTHAGLNE